MKRLLSVKEVILSFYELYARYVDGLIRFAFSLAVFLTLIYNTGYSRIFSNPLAALGAALICALTPKSMIAMVMCVLIVIQFASVSVEVMGITAVLLIVMLLSYFVFKIGNSWLMPLTLLLCLWNFSPALLPLGLLINPVDVIAVVFGVLVYAVIVVVKKDYSVLSSATGNLTLGKRMNLFLTDLFSNDRFLLILVALTVSILLIIVIRKLKINYAGIVAAIVGSFFFIVTFILGNFLLEVQIYYGSLVIGILLDAAISLFIIYFIVNMDYKRTEYVSFEDEEYVYYVKAVPKRAVAITEKKVKNFTEEQEDTDAR